MSAIVSGKCKNCGKEHYVSLGHPQWFDDVMKRRKLENEKFKAWKAWKVSGLCYNCYHEK